MTPLAQFLVRQALKTVPHGELSEIMAGEQGLLNCRCFEVSQVGDLIDDLMISDRFDPTTEKITSFLPAPVTWIERKFDWGRQGCLLHSVNQVPGISQLFKDVGGVEGIAMTQWFLQDGEVSSWPPLGLIFCDDGPIVVPVTKDSFWKNADDEEVSEHSKFCRSTLAALAIINTPRVIGRHEHPPHAGLQRDINRLTGTASKPGMSGWTEIRLHVTPPTETGEHTAPLTGQRARHYCRSFLRIRLGKLELVRPHWRGNADMGIRWGRYTVMNPDRGRSATQ